MLCFSFGNVRQTQEFHLQSGRFKQKHLFYSLLAFCGIATVYKSEYITYITNVLNLFLSCFTKLQLMTACTSTTKSMLSFCNLIMHIYVIVEKLHNFLTKISPRKFHGTLHICKPSLTCMTAVWMCVYLCWMLCALIATCLNLVTTYFTSCKPLLLSQEDAVF